MPDLTLPPLIRPDLALVVSRLVGRTTPEGNWGGTPHWLITKGLTSAGYYQIKMPGPGRVMVLAHRIGQEAFVGPIPDGLVVDHLCRVTNCWSPAHTEPVTDSVNIQRSARCQFRLTCSRGHAMTDDNIVTVGERTPRRHCRACYADDHPTSSLTAAEGAANARDAAGLKTHCKRGHELTPGNVYVYTNARGGIQRNCKQCPKDRARATS